MDSIMLPELLAPAGSSDALIAAAEAGADALYFGGSVGNARANAKNFAGAELYRAVSFLHDNGKKAYITLNTLYFDRELRTGSELLRFAEDALRFGADALIVQDMGAAALLRRYYPGAELHASTQAAAHNAGGVEFLLNAGFSRAVIARELPEAEIAALCARFPGGIEMFLHGALCSSYSGRCNFSYALGGTRSGNRGNCAQPCRMRYNGDGYPLSLKDLCLAGRIRAVIAAAPRSLKIEGRMRSADYVRTVVSVYRQLLDERRDATPAELKRLDDSFSRSGFTDGYFSQRLGSGMYGVRTDADKARSAAAAAGASPSVLPEPSAPPPEARYVIENPSPASPRMPHFEGYNIVLPHFSLLAECAGFLAERVRAGGIRRVYIPLCGPEALRGIPPRLLGVLGIRLPYVIHDGESESAYTAAKTLLRTGVRYALADNAGHIAPFAALGFTVAGGPGLNLANAAALEAMRSSGVEYATLSHEAGRAAVSRMVKAVPSAYAVYGRQNLMICENCLISNAGRCARRGGPGLSCPAFALRDRTGADFEVLGDFGHRSVVVNSVPLYLADKRDELERLGADSLTLYFTVEDATGIKRVVSEYLGELPAVPPKRFTRGTK